MEKSPILRACSITPSISVVAMVAILMLAGCSKDDDNPVVPNNVDNDSTMMVLIPAGTFRMGNITDHPDGNANEKPVHEVTITRPFLMGRIPVTQKLYEAVMGSNPSHFKDPDLPVENVTWSEAVVFCNTLSRREGLDSCYTGGGKYTEYYVMAKGYRLPTEAEWEYACRAGTETDFYTGNMTHSGSAPLDPALHRAGWYSGNAGAGTHPVRGKAANAFGLYDMHGNVREWCGDWFYNGYYASSPALDPLGPATGILRVQRGGAWNLDAGVGRSAYRSSSAAVERNSSNGFRLVRTY